MTRRSWITLVTGIAASAQTPEKQWWSQFRGPNSSGVGDGKPPVHFNATQNVQWKIALGPGLSSPIIWGRQLFVTEYDKDSRKFTTICIDRRNGNEFWRRSVTADVIEEVHDVSSPAGSTPTTDGERVYIYFGSYGLVCYDFKGNVVWERKLGLAKNPYGAVASPIVVGDLLIFNHQGKEAYLLAVNRRDGKTVWKTDRSQFKYGWSTPVHWRHDGIDEIVVLGGDFQPNQRLMAYNVRDGAELWWVAGLPPCGKSTPVVGGGMLFFAAPDIILEREAVKRNPERAEQFYEKNNARVWAIRPGGKGEINQTHVAWSEHKGVPGVPSPLFYKNRLYTFLNGGIVYARVASTGELVYSGRIGELSDYYSSPVAADNKVYIGSTEGAMVVLDTTGDELKVLARNKFDSGISATPALVDSSIYVRTTAYLYACGT